MGKTWIIIPVKTLERSKTRLSSVLAPSERANLTLQMLSNQLELLSRMAEVDGVMVVSRDPDVAELVKRWGGELLIEESDQGLNGALTVARSALEARADHILILPSDLPLMSAESVKMMLDARPEAAICRDRHGSGTNGIMLPTNRPFHFHFGKNSYFLHRQQFAQNKISFYELFLSDIAFDLDTPADWSEWQQLVAKCA